MTHDAAVRTLTKLGPELNKGNPEEVLLKYASANDLAAAQLEKLAQVYNVLAQVSQMQRGKDRGASCYQIDVPMLKKAFVDPPTKAASVRFIQETDDVRTVNLKDLLMTDVFELKKSASDVTVVEPRTPNEEFDVATFLKSASDLWYEGRAEVLMAANDFIKSCSRVEGDTRVVDISEALNDAFYHTSPLFFKAAHSLVKRLAPQAFKGKVEVIDYSPSDFTKRAFAVVTPESEKFAKVAENLGYLIYLKKIAAVGDIDIDDDTLPEVGEASPLMTQPFPITPEQLPYEQRGNLHLYEKDRLEHQKRIEEYEKAVKERIAREQAAAESGSKPEVVPGGLPPSGEHYTPARTDREGGGRGGSGGGDTERYKSQDYGRDTGRESGAKKKSWLGAFISGVKGVGERVGDAAKAVDGTISRATGKERINKHQRATDASVEDIRRSIQLRRLIAKDPVLREQDLQSVLEMYNSIARANPELATDMPAVLLALREAVAYDGLTLDSNKQLGEIRSTREKTEAQAEENRKRRYTI